MFFLRNFNPGINENDLCLTGVFPCPMLIESHFGLCLSFDEGKIKSKIEEDSLYLTSAFQILSKYI